MNSAIVWLTIQVKNKVTRCNRQCKNTEELLEKL